MADLELYSSDWPVVCSQCGDEIIEGDEYLILHRVKFAVAGSLGNVNKILAESPMCASCGHTLYELSVEVHE